MRALRRIANTTSDLHWSPTLIELLLDELVLGDELSNLIGPPKDLPVRRYPQAIAVALALRHSWREDLLRQFARRLNRAMRSEKRQRGRGARRGQRQT